MSDVLGSFSGIVQGGRSTSKSLVAICGASQ